MKKSFLGLLVLGLLIISSNSAIAANVPYDNLVTGDDTTITIDGKFDDWENVEGVNLTLKPAEDENKAVGNFDAQFRSVRDDSLIYFLIIIKDDFYYYNPATGIAHHSAPALGVAFPIDEGANNQFMGGTDRDSDDNLNKTTGMVDIIHWEMDVMPGEKLAGGSKAGADAKGDGVNNLDDEWATSPWNRHDDNDATSENSLSGMVTHTSGTTTNGTAGYFVFEFSRKLTTGDKYDHQFTEGETVPVAIAYWSPNANSEHNWGDDQHVVNYDSVIDMTLSTKTVKAPGFELLLGIAGIMILVPVTKKFRKNN